MRALGLLLAALCLACSPQDGKTADSLLQKANIAFHQAKRIQQKCLAYQTGMEDESARLISWETELLAGMQNDEFVLYFQPQLNVRDNKLDAFKDAPPMSPPSTSGQAKIRFALEAFTLPP